MSRETCRSGARRGWASFALRAVVAGLTGLGCAPPVNEGGAAVPRAAGPRLPASPLSPGAARSFGRGWYLEAISGDGRFAFLSTREGAEEAWRFRLVAIDGDATLSSREARAFESARKTVKGRTSVAAILPQLQTAELADDLAATAKLIGGLPFGAMAHVAVSPNGQVIVAEAADRLFVADATGHVKGELVPEVAYHPRFSPDGSALFFDRYERDHYQLYVTTSDASSRPMAVRGARWLDAVVAITEGGAAFRGLVSHEPSVKTCAIEVAMRPPYASRSILCLPDPETFFAFSPSSHGKWAIYESYSGVTPSNGAASRSRLRVLDLERAKVVLDEQRPIGTILGLSDEGVLVMDDNDGTPSIRDVTTGRSIEGDARLKGARPGFFRRPGELVVQVDGQIRVVAIPKP